MKKNLIINLISLAVTSLLLILTIMAWYTANNTVKATGITGKVDDYESIIEEINIYYATKVSDTQYTKGDLVSSGDQMIYDQFPEVYDPSTHDGIGYSEPPRLVELVLKQGKKLNQLYMESDTTYFPGTDNQTNPGYVEADENDEVNVPLSPFLKFNKATLSGTTITITSFKSYEYNESSGLVTDKKINVINESMSPRVYILFDFDDDKFNLLYSNNIGNDVIDEVNQINHYNDFKMLVFGGDI